MEAVQREGKSKARRDHIFAAGKANGKEEGFAQGLAQGLAEGIEKGKELVARDNASLKATNEALHKRLCELLEQSNGVATQNLLATQTAAEFVVEIQQYRNKVASLERTVADQTVELETLKKLTGDQAAELTSLRRASSLYLGTSFASASASRTRPGFSPYISRPAAPVPH